jgi:hypothetical protein
MLQRALAQGPGFARRSSKHAVGLIASLTDLRKAPLVEEEYHGPVLLSSDASADTAAPAAGRAA